MNTKLIRLLIAFILCFPQWGLCLSTYTELNPEAVSSLINNGIGAVYNIMGPDGGIRRIKVKGVTQNQDGSATVDYDFTDKVIIFDFENDQEFTYRPVVSSGESPDLIRELREGAGQASLSALQTGLIAGSEDIKTINKAFENIERLKRQMGENFDKIKEAQFGVSKALISLKVESNLRAGESLSIDLAQNTVKSLPVSEFVLEASDKAFSTLEWLSTDQGFRNRADKIRSTLVNSPIKDSIDNQFYQISKSSLIQADRKSFLGQNQDANILLDIAQKSADVLVGVDPFTGITRNIYESITGKNMVTGESLSDGGRLLALVGVFTAGAATNLGKLYKILRPIVKTVSPKTFEAYRRAKAFILKTGSLGVEVGQGSALRKVNLKSSLSPHWGLTKAHVQKHFFGKSNFALRKIDPHGNSDIWMQNLADLMQSPVTKTTANGAIDIMKVFTKADGNGAYLMGIRLWEQADGTYDLITVLTSQKGINKYL